MKKTLIYVTLLCSLCLVGCNNKNKIEDNIKNENKNEEVIVEIDDKNDKKEENILLTEKDIIHSTKEPLNIDKEVPDAVYSSEFKKEDLRKTDDGKYLKINLYNYDEFDYEDIVNLKKNDKITICNEEIIVEKIEEENETFININGGLESEDGYCLVLDGEKYRTVTYNDYPLYFYVTSVELKLSKDIILEDYADPEGNTGNCEKYEYENIEDAFDEYIGFSPLDTKVYVEDSEIVKIVRSWRP